MEDESIEIHQILFDMIVVMEKKIKALEKYLKITPKEVMNDKDEAKDNDRRE